MPRMQLLPFSVFSSSWSLCTTTVRHFGVCITHSRSETRCAWCFWFRVCAPYSTLLTCTSTRLGRRFTWLWTAKPSFACSTCFLWSNSRSVSRESIESKSDPECFFGVHNWLFLCIIPSVYFFSSAATPATHSPEQSHRRFITLATFLSASNWNLSRLVDHLAAKSFGADVLTPPGRLFLASASLECTWPLSCSLY